MFKNSFGYLVKEGLRNIRANRQMSVASIGVLIACMVLIGGALMLSFNINSLMGYVESFNEVVVWIDDDLGSAGTEMLKQEIAALPNITSNQYISKEDALKELGETLGSQSFLDGFEQYADENPLPASFRLKVDSLENLPETVKKLETLPGVESVESSNEVATTLMGIKTAIHEQNAFPGVTNKLLAREVNIVLAASADAVEKLGAPDKTTVVGNPVRPEVLTADRAAARAKLNAGDRTVILSFGGSLGADRINQVVADLCAWEKQTGRNTLHLHATGSRGVKLFEDLEKEKGFAPGENLIVTEYINNMPQLLAAADLVIARSGALTLAELEAVGRASVLIPSPNVAENHQYYNALELQKAGAAVVIEEKNLTGEGLVKTVEELLNTPGKLVEMGANAKTLGNPHSLDLITEKLMELMKN